MCFTDFDAPTVSSSSRPRARKAHRCYECSGTIAVGERHECFRGLWEGHWSTIRTCSACLKDRGRIVAREIADGCAMREAFPPFGGLHEVLHDYGLRPTRRRAKDRAAAQTEGK